MIACVPFVCHDAMLPCSRISTPCYRPAILGVLHYPKAPSMRARACTRLLALCGCAYDYEQGME